MTKLRQALRVYIQRYIKQQKHVAAAGSDDSPGAAMQTNEMIIEFPWRLSFTLIDLTGASSWKNGMASMMIEDPSFVCLSAAIGLRGWQTVPRR